MDHKLRFKRDSGLPPGLDRRSLGVSSRCPLGCEGEAKEWASDFRGNRIHRCGACSLRFLWPLPSPSEAGSWYQSVLYGVANADGTGFEPDVEAAWRRSDARSLRRIAAVRPVRGASLLDVGAGSGHLLDAARDQGYARLAAVDTSARSVEMLRQRGYEAWIGLVEDLDLPRFDVICAHHVLEHVVDPLGFLRRLAHLLQPGGVLHLLVPNEGSPTSRWHDFWSRLGLRRKPFRHLATDQHLTYFDQKSLGTAVRAAGLDLVCLGTTTSGRYPDWLATVIPRLLGPMGGASVCECLGRREPGQGAVGFA